MMDIHEVVMKLIGDISPIGETNEDNKRFENLKIMADLVDALLTDMDEIVFRKSNNQEYSIKRSVDFVIDFMDEIGIVQ